MDCSRERISNPPCVLLKEREPFEQVHAEGVDRIAAFYAEQAHAGAGHVLLSVELDYDAHDTVHVEPGMHDFGGK